jgi:hypothetical protein
MAGVNISVVQIGRWISPDTIIPDPANPQSFNRFSYVYNNPHGYVDSSGHMPWWLRYGIWQVAMTYYSGFGRVRHPLLHGRNDVQAHTEAIRQSTPPHLELIVAASIAHQASDPKDRPYGTSAWEIMMGSVDSKQTVGIAQLQPWEIEEWAPALAGQSRFDPDVAIRVMAAKIEAADQYILEQAEGYGGISQTDRFMLLAIAQNCGRRKKMENAVNTFFAHGMDSVLENTEYRLQLRLVVLHIDWLLSQGWVLPEGVDLDYWRRTAFSDEESAE